MPIAAEQVNSMFGDASVTLPDDIPHPAHWPEWELPLSDPAGGPTFKEQWRKWQENPDGYRPPKRPADSG